MGAFHGSHLVIQLIVNGNSPTISPRRRAPDLESIIELSFQLLSLFFSVETSILIAGSCLPFIHILSLMAFGSLFAIAIVFLERLSVVDKF